MSKGVSCLLHPCYTIAGVGDCEGSARSAEIKSRIERTELNSDWVGGNVSILRKKNSAFGRQALDMSGQVRAGFNLLESLSQSFTQTTMSFASRSAQALRAASRRAPRSVANAAPKTHAASYSLLARNVTAASAKKPAIQVSQIAVLLSLHLGSLNSFCRLRCAE